MSVETAVAGPSHSNPRARRTNRLSMILLTFPPAMDVTFAPLKPSRRAWARTRGVSPSAQALLVEASQRSSIVNGLLLELEQSDLFVYVADVIPGAVTGPASYLSFMHDDGTSRYVLIRIDRSRLSSHERIIWLGHELQHAVEVAAAPQVRDSDGLARLYRRIGWESVLNRFETLEASITGNRVRSEIHGRRL
jgi:hypothetical protein